VFVAPGYPADLTIPDNSSDMQAMNLREQQKEKSESIASALTSRNHYIVIFKRRSIKNILNNMLMMKLTY